MSANVVGMAHYQSDACWKVVVVCTKDHTHHPVNCTQSVRQCDGNHIKKGRQN